MAWKPKKDDNGNIALSENDQVIYVDDTGREEAIDIDGLTSRIAAVNAESAKRKEKIRELEAAQELLTEKFKGIDDPEAARTALETVESLKGKDKNAAEQLAEQKRGLEEAHKVQRKQLIEAHEAEKAKMEAARKADQQTIRDLLVGSAIKSSTFIADKTVLPGSVAASHFNHLFSVEEVDDGKGNQVPMPVGRINGEIVYSRDPALSGLPAPVDEFIGIYIKESLPESERNQILKSSGSGDGKGGDGNGNRGSDDFNPYPSMKK